MFGDQLDQRSIHIPGSHSSTFPTAMAPFRVLPTAIPQVKSASVSAAKSLSRVGFVQGGSPDFQILSPLSCIA